MSKSSEISSENLILEKFFAINLDLLYIADRTGTFMKLSQSWENMLGYTMQELAGRKYLEFIHADDKETTVYMMSLLGKHKQSLKFSNRYCANNGSYREIAWHVQYAGELIYAVGREETELIRKLPVITENKQIEEKLRASEANFRAFFETVDDMFIARSFQGEIFYANGAASRNLGYTQAEFQRMHVSDIRMMEERVTAEQLIRDVATGERSTFSNLLVRKDGTFLLVETRVWFGKWDGKNCVFSISKDQSIQQAALTRFQQLFNNSPVAMAISRMSDAKFSEVNTTFLDKHGFSRAEVIGKTAAELGLVVEKDKELELGTMIQTMGRIKNIEIKSRNKGGKMLVGLLSGECIEHQAEKVFLSVMTDITEQKELEEKLRASTEKFKLLFANMSNCAAVHEVILDEQGQVSNFKFLLVNKAFEAQVECHSAEVVGKTLLEVFPDTDAEIIKKYCKVGATGEAFRIKYYSKRSQKYFDSVVFRPSSGVVATIFQDITDRTEMKMALTESEERFKQLVEQFPEAIFEFDMNGNVTYANKHSYSHFSWTPADIAAGINIADFISEEDKEIVLKRVQDKAQGIDNGYIEYRAMRKDGSIFPAIGYATLITRDHVAVGMRAFIMDLTERKKSEAQLIMAKEEAESANVMKGQFIANMSHEIRTPMNGILGYLELLHRTNLSLEQKQFIHEAKVASEILLYLIDDILDLSKIETGKLVIEKNSFRIRAIIEDAVSILMPQAMGKNLELSTLIQSDVPEVVIGDPARLKQIINNLVSNAVKFTEEGQVAIVVSSSNKAKGKVRIQFEITDTGLGISEEDVQRIFKPFIQADSSNTRKFGGTGLGLAISKELIKLMDGNISVKSLPGQGSVFSFFIYLEVAKNGSKNSSFANLAGQNVLVVDDNASSRMVIRSYLAEMGCIVFEAEGADKAIMKILMQANTENNIGLAIVDDHMPGMNGYQLAATLQTIPFAKEVKLILLTSAVQDNTGKTAQQQGFSGKLAKPVRRDELLDCIATTLGLKQAMDEEEQGITDQSNIKTENVIKPRILLVEDNEMNRKLIMRVLKSEGMTCDVAADGKKAIQAVTARDYDIIFMDCQMPTMDGYESTAIIRAMEGEKKHTTIIALTANAMEGDKDKCIAAGMDDYISKPIKFDKMFRMIKASIKHSKQTAEDGDILEQRMHEFMQETGLNEGDARELLVTYTKWLPKVLVSANEMLAKLDFINLSKVAHQLKGSAGNLKLISIYELAVQLEDRAMKHQESECKRLLSEIEKIGKKIECWCDN